MNTRLQVEHPVTEMITGLDLVEWQLRVAAGEPLPQRAGRARDRRTCDRGAHLRRGSGSRIPAVDRHASRICAPPAVGADVRVDTGVREGDEISPYYDPMIAKLIVARRGSRLRRCAGCREALAAYEIVGVATNVAFLAARRRARGVRLGRMSTRVSSRATTPRSSRRPIRCPTTCCWPPRCPKWRRLPRRGPGSRRRPTIRIRHGTPSTRGGRTAGSMPWTWSSPRVTRGMRSRCAETARRGT